MSKGIIAVIGLGRFGRAVVTSLAHLEQNVLAIDRDPERVEMIADAVTASLVLDATDENAIAESGLERVTCVVVAMGGRATEASILTTALMRQIGVPRIIARSFTELHARVLVSVGAHEVINPEEAMGKRLAEQLANPSVIEQLDLGDAELAEIELAEAFVGKSLAELDFRQRRQVSVLALRRGRTVTPNPDADEALRSGDILIVLGTPDNISRLAART